SGIVIMDGGTAGLNLLPYLQGWRRVIVADAILGGGEPGTVYRLTPADLAVSRPGLSLHQVDLAWLLRLSDAEVIVYAIDLGGAAPQEFKVGLSPPIACAVEQVVAHIREELGSPPPANAGVSLPTGGF
ncbi:MAG: hydrogenase maturation protease, partial [Clostridia bacterium]|nr:hydrogenase maturation protease [Clostridia bacterium]